MDPRAVGGAWLAGRVCKAARRGASLDIFSPVAGCNPVREPPSIVGLPEPKEGGLYMRAEVVKTSMRKRRRRSVGRNVFHSRSVSIRGNAEQHVRAASADAVEESLEFALEEEKRQRDDMSPAASILVGPMADEDRACVYREAAVSCLLKVSSMNSLTAKHSALAVALLDRSFRHFLSSSLALQGAQGEAPPCIGTSMVTFDLKARVYTCLVGANSTVFACMYVQSHSTGAQELAAQILDGSYIRGHCSCALRATPFEELLTSQEEAQCTRHRPDDQMQLLKDLDYKFLGGRLVTSTSMFSMLVHLVDFDYVTPGANTPESCTQEVLEDGLAMLAQLSCNIKLHSKRPAINAAAAVIVALQKQSCTFLPSEDASVECLANAVRCDKDELYAAIKAVSSVSAAEEGAEKSQLQIELETFRRDDGRHLALMQLCQEEDEWL